MSPEVLNRRWQLASRLTAGAFLWAVGVILAALLLPSFDDQTISNAKGLTLTTATFVQVNGPWVLIPVALPLLVVAIVAVTLRARRTQGPQWAGTVAWAAVGGLLLLGLITIASIGTLALPVVLLLALALRLVPQTNQFRDRSGAGTAAERA
jgi:hypothetical protein